MGAKKVTFADIAKFLRLQFQDTLIILSPSLLKTRKKLQKH